MERPQVRVRAVFNEAGIVIFEKFSGENAMQVESWDKLERGKVPEEFCRDAAKNVITIRRLDDEASQNATTIFILKSEAEVTRTEIIDKFGEEAAADLRKRVDAEMAPAVDEMAPAVDETPDDDIPF